MTELIKTALTALGANKPRTALTMLGIIIGIASVISLLAIGTGAQQSIQNSVSALGSNLLTITAGSLRTGIVQGGAGSATTLTYDDAKAIKANVPNISGVSAELARQAQIVAKGANTNTTVTGALPDYLTVHNYQMQQGSFITQSEVNHLSRVAVIGPDTAANLFNTSNPIGQKIQINKMSFTIIGETVPKGSTGFLNADDYIVIPLTTAQQIVFGQDSVRSIVVQGTSADVLPQVQNDITSLLLDRHHITNPTNADFTIRNSTQTLSTLSSITSVFTMLLASIASISLIVGGIGIMNIMIVTVTERTREIGLRKAVGAKNQIILEQFLIEAIMLTLLSGLFGVVLGAIISLVLSTAGGVSTIITPFSILLSAGVSILIGVVFGLYPAMKAAKLSPIEALRYE